MAKLAEIRELNSILAEKRDELARQKERLFATKGSFQGVKPVGYISIQEDIVRLLKEIAEIYQQLSIKYLTLAAEAKNDYEEQDILATASKYAQHAHEANMEAESFKTSSI